MTSKIPAKTFAFVNEKGGSGKTTCVVNVAHAFALRGLRTLVVDLDKQRDATDTLLQMSSTSEPELTTVDVVLQGTPCHLAAVCADDGAKGDRFDRNLWVVPAHKYLHSAESELETQTSCGDYTKREGVLGAFQSQIGQTRSGFDVILFDTPGNPGILMHLALAASDGVVAVMKPSGFDVKGVGELKQTLELLRASVNPRLRLRGCILNEVVPRSRLARHWGEQVSRAFAGEGQFQENVPSSVRFPECASTRSTVFEKRESGTERLRAVFERIADHLVPRPAALLDQAGNA